MTNKNPMTEIKIARSKSMCKIYSKKLDNALKFRDYRWALELNNKIYEEVFERYSRGKPQNKDKERKYLKALFEDSYGILLKLNGLEEIA